jgi:hypothetical protein
MMTVKNAQKAFAWLSLIITNYLGKGLSFLQRLTGGNSFEESFILNRNP